MFGPGVNPSVPRLQPNVVAWRLEDDCADRNRQKHASQSPPLFEAGDVGESRRQQFEDARARERRMCREDLASSQGESGASTLERLHGAFRVIIQIADRWGLTDNQYRIILGYDTTSQIAAFRTEAPPIVSRDQKKRMQCVFEIHSTLFNLYRSFDATYRWLRTPMELLGGATPLATMLTGDIEDLLRAKYAASWFARR